MAAQGERELGDIVMCSSVLGTMVQDISEQDLVMGEQELPPQMDPKPKEAAVYDTSPSLLRNHPPIPAETAHPRAPGVARLFTMLAEMNNKLDVQRELIRETCRVTEKVTETVTVREKLNGVTETCTREKRHQVTECTETRETVEERLHGVEVKDAHTHTHTVSEGQWGWARRAC